jgi:hypothetical protein
LRRTQYLRVRSTQKLEEEIEKEKIYRKGKQKEKRENSLIRKESMRNLYRKRIRKTKKRRRKGYERDEEDNLKKEMRNTIEKTQEEKARNKCVAVLN